MDIQSEINNMFDERIKMEQSILEKRKQEDYGELSILTIEQRLVTTKLLKKLVNDKFREYRGEF